MLKHRLQTARAHVEYTMVQQVMRLPEPVLYLVSGGAGRARVGMRTLGAEMQVIAATDRAMTPLFSLALQPMRRRFQHMTRMLGGFVPYPVFTHARRVALQSEAGGRRELEVRIYTPERGPFPKPMLVYFHGGGWVLGSSATHEKSCQFLAHHADVIVVSVDYRLAPEFPFPLPLEDAIDAFQWVLESAPDMAGRADAVWVGGDSAGGNLAAALCQETSRRGLPLPAGQLLIYPATDLRRGTASHREMGENYLLTREALDFFVGHYTGSDVSPLDPALSPGLATPEVLAALPQAIVVTAGFDPLRDEGDAYAQALSAQGVDVAYEEFPHLLHGFFSMLGVSGEAREACTRVASLLRKRVVAG